MALTRAYRNSLGDTEVEIREADPSEVHTLLAAGVTHEWVGAIGVKVVGDSSLHSVGVTLDGGETVDIPVLSAQPRLSDDEQFWTEITEGGDGVDFAAVRFALQLERAEAQAERSVKRPPIVPVADLEGDL